MEDIELVKEFLTESMGRLILIGIYLVLEVISIVILYFTARKLIAMKNIPGSREIYIAIFGLFLSALFLVVFEIFTDGTSKTMFEGGSDTLNMKMVDLALVASVFEAMLLLYGVYGFSKLVKYLKKLKI